MCDSNKKIKMRQRAFTLIELLVVIAIIGLLASIVLIALNGARLKARDTTRIADISELQTAFELYFNDNSSYPTTTCGQNAAESTTGGTWSACWSTFLPAQYLAKMPADPTNVPGVYGLYYAMGYKPNGPCSFTNPGLSSDYILATHLENASDSPNSCSTSFGGWDNTSLNYVVGM